MIDGRDRLLILLAFAAGAVDAISFLGLDEVFTANMTGNTVLLGLALGQGEFDAVWRSATALGAFLVGVALAAAIVERDRAGPWPRSVTLTLGIESGVLGAFAILWAVAADPLSDAAVYGLIALAACAMGMQSGAVRRLHVPDVLTVVITGTLTTLVARLTSKAGRRAVASPAEAVPPLGLRAAVVAGVALGAVVGGAVELHAREAAALVPFAAVLAVVAAATWRHRSTATV